MRSALKAAAVAVICCAGMALADPAATDQTPAPASTNGNVVLTADNGNTNDPPPPPRAPRNDGMRDGRGGPGRNADQKKPDGQDGWRGRGGPMTGMRDGRGGSMMGMRDGRGGPGRNADQKKPDGQDGWRGRGGPMMGMRGGRGGPMMGMRGRMGGWMQRGNDGQRGESGAMQPKGLMLGVETGKPDPALSSQLDLPDGIGLVVDQVLPRSAAQSAGVEKYDVLEKLDDQIVVNADQVSVLIKMHKAGDKLALTVIRHGKPKELTATLSAAAPAERSNRPGRHANSKGGADEPGPTHDTSGAPAAPPATPHMEIPRADESSADSPAPATQPTAAIPDVLQQFADLFVD